MIYEGLVLKPCSWAQSWFTIEHILAKFIWESSSYFWNDNFRLNSRIFIFPAIDSPVETLLTASFHHLEEIFVKELHMPVKLAHKLSHRVLHPGMFLIGLCIRSFTYLNLWAPRNRRYKIFHPISPSIFVNPPNFGLERWNLDHWKDL